MRGRIFPRCLTACTGWTSLPARPVLIKGGVPHAIGSGCLLMEIQEPTDYTIRTERVTPGGLRVADAMCHQGLGFERMFDCFHYEPVTQAEAMERWFLTETKIPRRDGVVTVRLAGYEDTPCFELLRHHIRRFGRFGPNGAFFGLYAYEGSGTLRCGERAFALTPGTQVFVPAASAPFEIAADAPLTLFECHGPDSVIL